MLSKYTSKLIATVTKEAQVRPALSRSVSFVFNNTLADIRQQNEEPVRQHGLD